MLEANIVNLCMDALRDKNDTNHRLQLMLLANLSRDPDGYASFSHHTVSCGMAWQCMMRMYVHVF